MPEDMFNGALDAVDAGRSIGFQKCVTPQFPQGVKKSVMVEP